MRLGFVGCFRLTEIAMRGLDQTLTRSRPEAVALLDILRSVCCFAVWFGVLAAGLDVSPNAH